VLYEGTVYADPNLFFHNNAWYLFYTSPGDNDLNIYKSDTLEGEFKQLINTQTEHSRGAGNIFKHEGKIIRPVQDCSKIYGGATIFKEITLEPYNEKIINRLDPPKGFIGLHTYNFNDKWEVIDLKYEKEIH